MYQFGYNLLQLVLVIAGFTLLLSVWGYLKRRSSFLDAGRRGARLSFWLITLTIGILLYALLAHDFRVKYVASYRG